MVVYLVVCIVIIVPVYVILFMWACMCILLNIYSVIVYVKLFHMSDYKYSLLFLMSAFLCFLLTFDQGQQKNMKLLVKSGLIYSC